jgi:CO/xanthine dehydrogenase FAD-binding subunit
LDINTIEEIVTRPELPSSFDWREGDSWLGGGTWIFSEPQPQLRRLIDLDGFGWTPIELRRDALVIAATAKIAELNAWRIPEDWTAGGLIRQCCDALLGSFKIWNMATVGGNICLSLPAGPMSSLASALGGACVVWERSGGERRVPAADFVTGDRTNVLLQGELLRAIELPLEALRSRAAFRQISLTPRGRSGALLIGLHAPDGGFALTVTASTVRPVRLTFPALPDWPALEAAMEGAIPAALYHDDVHGRPDWRRHVTRHLANDILSELAA